MSDSTSTDDFVGRTAQLSAFQKAISDARQGLPSVILLGGDAGIGKTTTVREAARRAGVVLHLGRSTHIGGDAIPLAPLADLLRQVRRSRPDLLSAAELAPLHDWFATGSEATRSLGSSQANVFIAVLELLGHLTRDDAALLCFEDLHWADAVTWYLFEYLARNLIDEQVVLVGTFRTNEVAARQAQRTRLAELSRLPAAQRVQLEGLDRNDVAERISSLIGSPAPGDLVDQVISRGQGNPFFTRELVAAHIAGESIPMVLSDLISVEVAGLDRNARAVLGAVAAIGRDTNHDLLAGTVALRADELEIALRLVIDAQLLVVDNDAYRFRHPLLSEVVYADLLPPERTRLHRKLAEVFAQQSPDLLRRADVAGELAFHLDRSGDGVGAFFALLAAADAAETVAPGAAFTHLMRALELWDAVGKAAAKVSRIDRLWQAAEIAATTVGNLRAIELARAAFELGPPPLGEAWGHERLGRYLWVTGQLEESRAEFALAAQLLSDSHGPEVAAVFAGLGQAELMSGNYASAESWCMKVFAAVPKPDDNPTVWTIARRVLGVVRSNQGKHADAIALCRESLAAATTAQSRAFATVYTCVALMDAGQFQEAVNTALDAVADAQVTGLHGFDCYFDSLAADALIRLGRWSEAEALFARQPLVNTFPASLLRLARAQAMLAARRGDADLARNYLATASELAIDGWHQSILDATVADVQLALGNWTEAEQASALGWETARTTSSLWAARFAMFLVVATVERALDMKARREVVDVASITERLMECINALDSPIAGGPDDDQRDSMAHKSHAIASITRLATSDPDMWAEAATRWTDLGDRWAAATALLREAEAAAHLGSADRAALALQEAHATASQLGATRLLAEIEAVSRRTRVSVEAPRRLVISEDSAQTLGLTAREAEVLSRVAAGRTNRQIGDELYVSDKTVSVHVSNILRKLGVNTRVDAAAVAQRVGIA